MSSEENGDRARQRFAALVRHLIDHTADHATELVDGKPAIDADPIATRLLDEALATLTSANSQLNALLTHIGRDAVATRPHTHEPPIKK